MTFKTTLLVVLAAAALIGAVILGVPSTAHKTSGSAYSIFRIV